MNAPAKAERFPVKLLKNFRPKGEFEIVGYQKPAVRVKNAAGQMIEVEPAEFLTGVGAPAPYAGSGYEDKIWAETVVKLDIEEAKRAISLKIAERADALPA